MPVYTVSTTLPAVPVSTATAPHLANAGNELWGASGAGVVLTAKGLIGTIDRLVIRHNATVDLEQFVLSLSMVGNDIFTTQQGTLNMRHGKIYSNLPANDVRTFGCSFASKIGDGLRGTWEDIIWYAQDGTSVRFNLGAFSLTVPVIWRGVTLRNFVPQTTPGVQYPGTVFSDPGQPAGIGVNGGTRYNIRLVATAADTSLLRLSTWLWDIDGSGFLPPGNSGGNVNTALNVNPVSTTGTNATSGIYTFHAANGAFPAMLSYGQRWGTGSLPVIVEVKRYQAWNPAFLDNDTRGKIADLKIKQTGTIKTFARKPAVVDNTVRTLTPNWTADSTLGNDDNNPGFLIENTTSSISNSPTVVAAGAIATAITDVDFEEFSYTHETYDNAIARSRQSIPNTFYQDRNFAAVAPDLTTNLLTGQGVTAQDGFANITEGSLVVPWNAVVLTGIHPPGVGTDAALIHLRWTQQRPTAYDPLISYETADGVVQRLEVKSDGKLSRITDGAAQDTRTDTAANLVSFTGVNDMFLGFELNHQSTPQAINAALVGGKVWDSESDTLLTNRFDNQTLTGAAISNIRVGSINYRGARVSGFANQAGFVFRVRFTPTQQTVTVPFLGMKISGVAASATFSVQNNGTIRVSNGTNTAILQDADGNVTVNYGQDNLLVGFIGTPVSGTTGRAIMQLNGAEINTISNTLPLPNGITGWDAIRAQTGQVADMVDVADLEVAATPASVTNYTHDQLRDDVAADDNYFGTPASESRTAQAVVVINGAQVNDIVDFHRFTEVNALRFIRKQHTEANDRNHYIRIAYSAIDTLVKLAFTHPELLMLYNNRFTGIQGGLITPEDDITPAGSVRVITSQTTRCRNNEGVFESTHEEVLVKNPLAVRDYDEVTTDMDIGNLDDIASLVARLCYDDEAGEIGIYPLGGNGLAIHGGLDLFSTASANDLFNTTLNYDTVADNLEIYAQAGVVTKGARFTKVIGDVEIDGIGVGFDVDGDITNVTPEDNEVAPAVLPVQNAVVNGKIIIETLGTAAQYLYLQGVTTRTGLVIERSATSADNIIYVHGITQSASVRFGDANIREADLFTNVLITGAGASAILVTNSATGAVIDYQDNQPAGAVGDDITITINRTQNPVINITVRRAGYEPWVTQQADISALDADTFTVTQRRRNDGVGNPLYTGTTTAGITPGIITVSGTVGYYIQLTGTPQGVIYTLQEIYDAGEQYSTTQEGMLAPLPAFLGRQTTGAQELLLNGWTLIAPGIANVVTIGGGAVGGLDDTALQLSKPDTLGALVLGSIQLPGGGSGGGGASTNDLIEAMRQEWGDDWATARAQATDANTQATQAVADIAALDTKATALTAGQGTIEGKVDTAITNSENAATRAGNANTNTVTILTDVAALDTKADGIANRLEYPVTTVQPLPDRIARNGTNIIFTYGAGVSIGNIFTSNHKIRYRDASFIFDFTPTGNHINESTITIPIAAITPILGVLSGFPTVDVTGNFTMEFVGLPPAAGVDPTAQITQLQNTVNAQGAQITNIEELVFYPLDDIPRPDKIYSNQAAAGTTDSVAIEWDSGYAIAGMFTPGSVVRVFTQNYMFDFTYAVGYASGAVVTVPVANLAVRKGNINNLPQEANAIDENFTLRIAEAPTLADIHTQASEANASAESADTQATQAVADVAALDAKVTTVTNNQATIVGNQATIDGKVDALGVDNDTITANQATIEGKVDTAVTQATGANAQATDANTQATQAVADIGTADGKIDTAIERATAARDNAAAATTEATAAKDNARKAKIAALS